MDMENIYNCDICMEIYDENIRPRSLNCGHTFCTFCLDRFIKERTQLCPQCQQPFRATSALDFPINYSIEKIICKLKESQFAAYHSLQSEAMSRINLMTTHDQTPDPQDLPYAADVMSSKMKSILLEQRDSTQNLVHESNDNLSHLLQYLTFLIERKEKHEKLHAEVIEHINKELEKINEVLKKGEALKSRIPAVLENVDSITSAKSASVAIDELDKWNVALEGWKRSFQQHLPNTTTVRCSDKVVRDTTDALALLATGDDADAQTSDQLHYSLPIMVKLKNIQDGSMPTQKNLQSVSKDLKNKIEKGELYAIQLLEGRKRFARVTMNDGKTYLHHLINGEPPRDSQTIQHDDLIETLQPDSVVVFMDLEWEGDIQGRIHILLSPDTPLARHFRILCTGDLGPSYYKTYFFKAEHKGNKKYENLIGGNYDGKGGTPLMKGLNVNEEMYQRKGVAGLVWSVYDENDGPRSAQFGITTGSGSGTLYYGAFGQVQMGIDVVRAAVKYGDITYIKIANCGVILPL